MYVNVIINSTAQSVDRSYLYRAKDSLQLKIGDMILVNFGQGSRKEKAFVVEIKEEIPGDIKDNRIKDVLKVLERDLFTEDDFKVVKFMKENYLSSYLDGIKLFLPRGNLDNLRHRVRNILITVKKPTEKDSWIKTWEYIKEMENKGGVIKSQVVEAGFSISFVNSMLKRGYLEISEDIELRIKDREYDSYGEKKLTEAQRFAFNKITSGENGVYLLHGVTGSGKTEVFLNIVKETLKSGGDSVILVPEISLTPQLIERVKGRFGKNVSIYHSRLSDGERFDEWKRIKEGRTRVTVGARSALFLPFRNLKTIIIDEEHEMSYKSETNPKYHAREVAEFIAELKGAKVILSSATPSVESYYLSKKEEYHLVELKERVGGGEFPEVISVDLKEELKWGNRSIYSRRLYKEMKEALDRKEQIILFLNRRGISGFVSCRSCGFVYKCSKCSVSLTKHEHGKLICHHCGHTEYQRDKCPSCGSRLIKEFGTGTQKVEESVRKLFPDARVLRMDKDTTRQKDSYEKIYEDFKEGKADILIGTQMIAKGLDFDNVSLVGIIAADISMNLPDFRAFEKTFQLVNQVSGRAGRKKGGGKVILQSYSPYEYPLVTSSKNDYEGFYNQEIKIREIFSYPPLGHLASFVVSYPKEEDLNRTMGEIKDRMEEILSPLKNDGIIILGPNPCLISKLKNFYRSQIIVKGIKDNKILATLKEMVYSHLKGRDYRVSIDPNPQIIL